MSGGDDVEGPAITEFHIVIPAKAGIQCLLAFSAGQEQKAKSLDSHLCGKDELYLQFSYRGVVNL